jgi:hypothetical protein
VRDFAAAAGRLRTLSFGAKLLYSAFTASAVLGLIVSWRLYGSMVGEAGAAAYYAGAPVSAPDQPARSSGAGDDGPVLELPDDVATPQVLVEQVSDRKLLEVTHFHLFSVPVYVLILAHLWLLARLPGWLHSAGVIASVMVSALHLAAPWIVRGRTELSALVPISGAGMLLVLGVVAAVPTVDMWLPRPTRRAGGGAEEGRETDPAAP